MMKTLKLKIFASFMLLVVMLAVAGVISVVEFRKLSFSVHGMIENNYKSIEAGRAMIDALEREDSGVLLLLLGDWSEGSEIIRGADSLFLVALNVAKNNITEKGERENVLKIESNYVRFKGFWSQPIPSDDRAWGVSWYKDVVHPAFVDVKASVDVLITLNQDGMLGWVTGMREKAKRAMMPGIVAIVSSVLFSLLLNFFITKYFVDPISKIVRAVDGFSLGDKRFYCEISSNDEIKKLADAIGNLILRIGKK